MAIDLDILRNIAEAQVEKKVETEADLADFLKIWWSRKYKRPNNHPLLLALRLEELALDYYRTKILDDLEFEGDEDGKKMTIEDQEKYEEGLKEKMGDSYKQEYDFLIPPTEEELAQARADRKKDVEEEEYEEDF